MGGAAFFCLKSASRAIFRAGRSGLGEEEVYSFNHPPLEPVSIPVFPGGSDLLVQTRAQISREAAEAQLHKVSLSTRTVLSLGSPSENASQPIIPRMESEWRISSSWKRGRASCGSRTWMATTRRGSPQRTSS
jgi:hypothetical protein